MRYFLAFSYNLHDSSVSIADEERVLLVLEAERFFGEKKKQCDHREMEQLIAVALRHCGIGIGDVDAVACTSYRNEHLPEGRRDFKWVAEQRVEIAGRAFDAVVLNHHLAHAAIVYAFPAARDVVIDVCDGGGDFGDSHFTYRCRGNRIEQLPNKPVHDAFSARFYDVMSRYLYRRRLCEGKMMALASLGQARPEMMGFIREHLAMFHEAPPDDSCAELARHYPVGDDHVASQTGFDLAASVQRVFEELRVQSVVELPADAPQVLLAGGATLNILANTRVREVLGPGRELLVPPVADDSGQSLGALLYLCHERVGLPVTATMPFIGYSDHIEDSVLAASDASDELVSFLAGGGIAFLHRGQSEIGPRALGHRSIIAVPTPRSYDLINHVIKQREFYRPVAPLVPEEAVSDWFEWEGESRYMLFAAAAREKTRLQAAGICHYDNTARLQTVSGDDPFLHAVLTRVGEATGCPILINTSLNPRGVPILSRIEETRAFARRLAGLNVRVFHDGRLLPVGA